MWAKESIFYQIFPLGFCGAPEDNDQVIHSRILKVEGWIPHMKNIGVDAVYFSPVFESDRHGYDTRDYFRIDCRLGSNEDFKRVCKNLHEAGIRVVLDGVFNHVGRGFWAFQDVLKNRENSVYKDWFFVDFHGDSNYKDGLWYEGWEGHFDLVKLNLRNLEVKNHIFEAIKMWKEDFAIDGLRLDVAYLLDHEFLHELRLFTEGLDPEFFLIGEMLFGDYGQIVNDGMLQSCTNYEVYKGIYSSLNDVNLFEISYSLNRQFGNNASGIYNGKNLMTFVDNHDVSRIASMLKRKEHLPLAYGMLFTIPGIPCLYYGSEWGIEGDKKDGDWKLRPNIELPIENDLTKLIKSFAKVRAGSKAIKYGTYENVLIRNEQLVYLRSFEQEKVLVLVNAISEPFQVDLSRYAVTGRDLLSGAEINMEQGVVMPPYSVQCIQI